MYVHAGQTERKLKSPCPATHVGVKVGGRSAGACTLRIDFRYRISYRFYYELVVHVTLEITGASIGPVTSFVAGAVEVSSASVVNLFAAPAFAKLIQTGAHDEIADRHATTRVQGHVDQSTRALLR